MGPAWKALDAESPPEMVTMTLGPGDIWRFSMDIKILTGKDGSSQKKSLPFEEYSEISPFYLRVYLQAWEANIDPKDIRRRGFVFGEKLQKRWKNYGHLILRDMTSAAIEVDFRKLDRSKAAQYRIE